MRSIVQALKYRADPLGNYRFRIDGTNEDAVFPAEHLDLPRHLAIRIQAMSSPTVQIR
jgi:hypothetical protein